MAKHVLAVPNPTVIPTEAPVLAFARKHGGEAEESISIASPKANQKVKVIYWKRH